MGNDYKRVPVRVWNDSDGDYTEVYQGETITIKAHEFVTMGRSRAASFIGSMSPAVPQTSQNKLARAEKKLRMEMVGPVVAAPEVFKSMVDGKIFDTKAELDAYDKQFSDKKLEDKELDETEKPAADVVMCPICRKTFKGKAGLKIHLSKDNC